MKPAANSKAGKFGDLGLEKFTKLRLVYNDTKGVVEAMPDLEGLTLGLFPSNFHACKKFVQDISGLKTFRISMYGSTDCYYDAPSDFFVGWASENTLETVSVHGCGFYCEHLWPILGFPNIKELCVREPRINIEGGYRNGNARVFRNVLEELREYFNSFSNGL